MYASTRCAYAARSSTCSAPVQRGDLRVVRAPVEHRGLPVTEREAPADDGVVVGPGDRAVPTPDLDPDQCPVLAAGRRPSRPATAEAARFPASAADISGASTAWPTPRAVRSPSDSASARAMPRAMTQRGCAHHHEAQLPPSAPGPRPPAARWTSPTTAYAWASAEAPASRSGRRWATDRQLRTHGVIVHRTGHRWGRIRTHRCASVPAAPALTRSRRSARSAGP